MSERIQKTKKQHYVPRCYLDAWAVPNKYQVHVYDLKTDMQRISNINDIASENHFYDFIPDNVFSKQALDAFHKYGILLDSKSPFQGIEHAFANYIEDNYSKLLKKVINDSKSATPWIINNCYFISEQQKADMSEFLALQFIRTKKVRNMMLELSTSLEPILKDMGASVETLDKCKVDKERAKNIHARMLMNNKDLPEISKSFWSLTWVLGINKTEKKFYTSDNPIGTHAHIKDPIMSMSGLQSPGVEVFFPISPNCILLMFDGSYHNHIAYLERKYVLIDDELSVDYYNSLCVLRCERCVFSNDGDYKLVKGVKKRNPDVFINRRQN